jgi:prepilin-type N-terminal cleavage/methylation domain-containing protein
MMNEASAESRAGASLVEVVVSITILGIGAALATRTLELAAWELDRAELGARAILLLSELHDGFVLEGERAERRAGPGFLVPHSDNESLHVQYEPPSPTTEGRGARGTGYREARSWLLRRAP